MPMGCRVSRQLDQAGARQIYGWVEVFLGLRVYLNHFTDSDIEEKTSCLKPWRPWRQGERSSPSSYGIWGIFVAAPSRSIFVGVARGTVPARAPIIPATGLSICGMPRS